MECAPSEIRCPLQLFLHISNLKPSNVLVNRAGVVKLSDFVVSPQLVEAFANGFVGLRTYMAPERTVGEQPGRSSDIWSLGLVLMELAIGHYPIPAIDPVDFVRAFAPDRESNMVEHWRAARTGEHLTALEGDTSGPNSLFELLVCVVEHPAPRLPAYCFSADFIHMIHSCLQKEPHDRLSIELLHSRIIPDLLKSTEEPVDNCVQPKCLDVPSSCPDSISVSPSPVTIVDYLNGVFARQQAEAIDAVALVVGDDMDAVDESMTSSGVGKNWDPLSATVTRPSDSD
ncbi:unnamed protein product [Calicophoron daubneyi]|uniref:Protein kinase domain-containing protein n=1 Tax=Calicophoron daubneyi TaxID=300641 RepID=A0AAV2T108_CALDB